ncbi:unnamed protein product [Rotaria socialis]|nr:unnamed protein product [Rotaria socialis]CAF4350042.1 unnamed protein product [Rotaria socialis]
MGKGSQSKKYFSGSLPSSTITFQEHCLRSSRQIKIWLDALEPFLIAPAMFRNGYNYSNTQDKMKIKWSTLNDQLTDYRLETCGECKGSCTRCKYYKNNLSCTVFCKCNQDMCYNRNIYGSSSQQLKNKFDKLQVTTSLMQYNRNDEMSTKSDPIYLNDTNINESHSGMALDESNIDPEIKYSDTNVTNTPTGRRLSSETVMKSNNSRLIKFIYKNNEVELKVNINVPLEHLISNIKMSFDISYDADIQLTDVNKNVINVPGVTSDLWSVNQAEIPTYRIKAGNFK